MSSRIGQSFLKEITIKDFRAIQHVNFKPGRILNVLSGKNGSGKSTILGMIAQPFSFESGFIHGFAASSLNDITDPQKKAEAQNLINSTKTIYGLNFQSNVNQHFELSPLDLRGVEHASFIFDHKILRTHININIVSTNSTDRVAPRFVTRKPGYPIGEDRIDRSSSNEVFPVIYLGLKRVTPIVQETISESVATLSASETIFFNTRYSEILLNNYNYEIKSTSVSNKKTHASLSEGRDLKMISSGEDNVGQILAALISFKRLKENYSNYTGGILLIDEIEATMYPGSQKQLLKVLYREAEALKIQVFITSHSMYLIDSAIDMMKSSYGINVIATKKNQNGLVTSIENLSSEELWSLLHESSPQALNTSNKSRLYFEDEEAIFVFNSIIIKQFLRREIKIVDATLGCDSYISLREHRIPEFTNKAVVVLDGDQLVSDEEYSRLSPGEKRKIDKINSFNNFICLPSINSEPPEKMIYNYIADGRESDFWNSTNQHYTFEMFMQNPHNTAIQEILHGTFNDSLSLRPTYRGKKERNVWKMWFNEEKRHWRIVKNNPFRHWASNNKELILEFEEKFINTLNTVRQENGEPPLSV